MFSKRNVLLSAKVSLCAMLMLLTASVASASVAGDFGITDVGNSYLTKSSANNLALTVTVPDGVNGNTEDLLLKDGGDTFWSGDTLVALPPLGSTLGVGYYELVPNGYNGTEPVVRDLDSDGLWTANADTDIDGVSPAAGFPLTSVKDPDWTDLYFYDAAGGGAWAAGADMIFSDDGAVYYDVGLDTLEAGTGLENAAGVLTEPAGWGTYYHDDVNDGGQYAPGVDWIGVDDDGDGLLTDAADTVEIDGADALPSPGDALYSVGLADNVCSDNVVLASATCVYSDTDGTPCDGTQGSGVDFLGTGCEAGGDVQIVGANNWATNEAPDATSDWFTENAPGPFTYSAAADTTIDGTAPAAGTIIGNTKDFDWTTLYFYDISAATWEPGADMVFTDDGNVYFDATMSSDVLEAGVSLENGLGASAEPGSWDLWFRDAVNSNDYSGAADWIGVDAGGFGTYSTSADTDVYSVGGMSDTDTLTGFGADCNGVGATNVCLHTGATPIDGSESIFEDNGDDQGAASNGVLDVAADQLTAIEIQTTGTAADVDISAMKVWADGGDDAFDAGGADDALLGTAVWDAADSWDLGALTQPIAAGGQKLYVSLDMTSNPTHTQTFILGIPQNGVTVASNNDGPTDADKDAPAGTNTKTIHNTTSGGGGSGGGGSAIQCGNNDLDTGETCDDGGRTSGDGCSSTCDLEEGYVWDSVNEEVVLETELPTEPDTTTEEEPTEDNFDQLDMTEEDIINAFLDVDLDHWAAHYIEVLFSAGIMEGMGDGTFGVANGTTRAEIVKIALLLNGAEVPASVDAAPFKDTPVSEWYTPYVTKAVELGIVEGYSDGNFRPGNKVKRGEALKILLLAAEIDLTDYDLSSATDLSDVSETIWFAIYVAYALDNEIVEGYEDGTFKGGNDILRGEIAKVVVLLIKSI